MTHGMVLVPLRMGIAVTCLCGWFSPFGVPQTDNPIYDLDQARLKWEVHMHLLPTSENGA